MTNTTQTDRLESGHHVTLTWSACDGTARTETYQVGDNPNRSSIPETVSVSWIEPLIGKSVGSKAELGLEECNSAVFTIKEIKLPPAHADVIEVLTPKSRLPYWHADHPLRQPARRA